MELGAPFPAAEQPHQDKHQCCEHAPKPTGQKGNSNQIKPVLEQIELYAFLNQNKNVKFLINTRQCTAALTWHLCSALMGGEQSRAVPPWAWKMEKYWGFASQKQLSAFPPSLKQWVTLSLAWWRMCLVSTGGNSGIVQECQAFRHNTVIGKSAWITLERCNVGCKLWGWLLTQTTDPSLWNVRPLSPKIVFCLLFPCMIHGIFSLLLCVLQCSWKRACAVHTEKLS